MKFNINPKGAFFVLVSVVVVGNLFFFGFQNCGRARLGIQDSPSQLDKGQGGQGGGGTGGQPTDKTPSCPTGQVAVGLDAQLKPVCLTSVERSGDTCNVGEYVYKLENNKALCILVSDRAAISSPCEFNRQLASYTDSGSMVCVRMPAVQPNYSCSGGKPVRGVHNSQAVCDDTTPADPLSVSCPTGQYLENISDGKPVCKDLFPGTVTALSCPAGKALIGISAASEAVCQQLFQLPQPNTTCAGDQYISAVGNEVVSCANLVMPDLAHYCPEGKYLSAISRSGMLCTALPNAQTRYNGTCESGKYLMGFKDQAAVCKNIPNSGSMNFLCPRGFYAAGYSNGNLVCKPFDDTSVLVCQPNVSRDCDGVKGSGSQVCNQEGKGWGQCLLNRCDSGYDLNAGVCKPTECQAGFKAINGKCEDLIAPLIDLTAIPPNPSNQNIGNFAWTIKEEGSGLDSVVCRVDNKEYKPCDKAANFDSLAEGAHRFEVKASDKHGNWSSLVYNWIILQNSMCRPNSTKGCDISNGLGLQVCKNDGTSYGPCIAVRCNTGYIPRDGICVKRVDCPNCPKECVPRTPKLCEVEHGVGVAYCNQQGSGFGDCETKECHIGYQKRNGKCEPIPVTCPDCPQPVCSPGHQQNCSIDNGYGAKICNEKGTGYDSCVAFSCKAGFVLKDGVCQKGECNSCDCGKCPPNPRSCDWSEILIGDQCVPDESWQSPVCPVQKKFTGFIPGWSFDDSFMAGSCKQGFEVWNRYKSFYLTEKSKNSCGNDRWIHVEFASYQDINTYSIYAINKKAAKTLIFQPCWVSTDPDTEGKCKPQTHGRPRDSAIRSYKVKIPAGTVKLYFAPGSKKPYYLKVTGLCDFKTSPDGLKCRTDKVVDSIKLTQ